MEVLSIPSAYERMTVCTLFSGSKGNSVYIRCGASELLVDAGMSARAEQKALETLGSGLERIAAVFVTHEHIDHVRGIDVLSRRANPDITVHAAEKTAACLKCARERLFAHPAEFSVEIGDLSVSSFVTPHDSVCSVGYVIRDMERGRAVGIATDMGYMPDSVLERLCGCQSVILESNHDVDMLMSGPYPYDLKMRILSRRGHLSNADCAAAAVTLAKNGVRRILLAHLSEENNTPALALRTTAQALEQAGAGDVFLDVASQSAPVRLL